MAPLLFLDIDGVLNSVRFIAESARGEGVRIVDGELDATHHLDPVRIGRLNRLVEQTGARVVLSSTWRLLFGLPKTQASLVARGFAHRLADATPRILGEPRHTEIRAYLSSLAAMPPFVVIDDAEEAGIGFGRRFVRIADGLEDAHVELAVKVLADAEPGP